MTEPEAIKRFSLLLESGTKKEQDAFLVKNRLYLRSMIFFRILIKRLDAAIVCGKAGALSVS